MTVIYCFFSLLKLLLFIIRLLFFKIVCCFCGERHITGMGWPSTYLEPEWLRRTGNSSSALSENLASGHRSVQQVSSVNSTNRNSALQSESRQRRRLWPWCGYSESKKKEMSKNRREGGQQEDELWKLGMNSFIPSGYLYSTPSSLLLLRGVSD